MPNVAIAAHQRATESRMIPPSARLRRAAIFHFLSSYMCAVLSQALRPRAGFTCAGVALSFGSAQARV